MVLIASSRFIVFGDDVGLWEKIRWSEPYEMKGGLHRPAKRMSWKESEVPPRLER